MLGQALHKQPVPCWSQPGALRAAQLVTGQFRCTFGALGAVFKVFVMKLLVILLFLGLLSGCRGNSSYSLTPQLLLVSFDGFRADYLQNYDFPHLQNFIKEGVLVEHVTNVFITKTFPNHYSIVTGLYEESHGIVANSMYDEVTKKHFSETNDKDPFWWDGAVPIWVTNQLQENRSSAAAMWPGTDVPIHNTTPSYFMNYSSSVPFEERLNNVTEWLSSSNPPVTFATLYWEEPDASGHRYGPEDKGNMSRVLKEIDGLVGDLVQRLKVLGLWENLNVIITSDHGMTQCSENRLIHLDSCLDHSNYTVIDLTPVAAILPKINVTEVYDKLKHCSPHMTVYLKEEIPDRFHYQHNDRIQPIILVADEGWTIVLNKSSLKLESLGTCHINPRTLQQTSISLKWKFMKFKTFTDKTFGGVTSWSCLDFYYIQYTDAFSKILTYLPFLSF
nr:bis(5'-adenosyl)-triphosphatase ENPP4 isoform X3 [Peromyscus maniculatus bairdii]XP_042122644.1 bis(5'-adenosyl)-triphosphatase ENPP4 isoform X3 [Peromyscus maniculatus bairdii]